MLTSSVRVGDLVRRCRLALRALAGANQRCPRSGSVFQAKATVRAWACRRHRCETALSCNSAVARSTFRIVESFEGATPCLGREATSVGLGRCGPMGGLAAAPSSTLSQEQRLVNFGESGSGSWLRPSSREGASAQTSAFRPRRYWCLGALLEAARLSVVCRSQCRSWQRCCSVSTPRLRARRARSGRRAQAVRLG